jgi:hypothetical protein
MIGTNLVLTCNHTLEIPDTVNDYYDAGTLKVRFDRGSDPANEEAYPVTGVVFQGREGNIDGVTIEHHLDFALLELGPSEVDQLLPSDKGIKPLRIHNDPKPPRDTAVYVIGYPGKTAIKTVADNARIFLGFNSSYKTQLKYELEMYGERQRLVDKATEDNKDKDETTQLVAVQTATRQGEQLAEVFKKSFRPGVSNPPRWYLISGLVEYPPHPAFVLDSDTYHGNSGSPVFSRQSSEVTGMLFRGMDDKKIDLEVGYLQHEEAIPILVILKNWKENDPQQLTKYNVNF